MSEGTDVGKLHGSIELEHGNFDSGVVAVNQGLELINKGFEGLKKVGEMLVGPFEQMLKLGDSTANLAAATGIGVEALQKMAFAGEAVGVSMDSIGHAMQRFQRNLVTGSEASTAAIKQLGLSRESLANMLPEEQLTTILTALNTKIPNAANRSQIAIALLGRAGAALVPLGANMKEVMDKAEALGAVMSKSDIEAANKMKDSIGELEMTMAGLQNNIGSVLTNNEALATVIEKVTELFGEASKWVHANREALEQLVTKGISYAVQGIGMLIEAFAALYKGAGYIIFGIGSLVTNFSDFVKGSLPMLDALHQIELGMGGVVVAAANMAKATALAMNNPLLAKGADLLASSVTSGIAEHQAQIEGYRASVQPTAKIGGVLQTVGKSMIDNTAIEDAGVAVAKFGESLDKLPSKHDAAADAGKRHGVVLQTNKQQLAEAAKSAHDYATLMSELGVKLAGAAVGVTPLQKAFMGIDAEMVHFTDKVRENKLLSGEAFTKANAAIQTTEDALKAAAVEAERLSVLGPNAKDATAAMDRIADAAARTGTALSKLSDTELKKIIEDLRKQVDLGGDSAKANKLLADATTEAIDRNNAMSASLGFITTTMSVGQAAAIRYREDQVKAATESADAWGRAAGFMAGLVSMFSQLGGSRGGFGTVLGAGASITQSISGYKKLQEQAAESGEKISGGQKAQAIVGGAIALGQSVYGNKARLDSDSAGGRAVAGAAMGAQIGSIAGPWGMAAGAVVGAIIGALHKPSWIAVGKDAGKELGFAVSEELAKAIEATGKKLKLSNKDATLLNLDKGIQESGKAATAFAPQINDLIKGIADKSIPAKEGMEELSKSFGLLATEAAKSKFASVELFSVMKQARESKVMTDEMKASITAAVDAMATAMKNTSGLKIASAQTAVDSATIFALVWTQTVAEKGLVGAADALGDAFKSLQDRLAKSGFGEAAAGIFAPIEQQFALATNELFAGAANAAQGYADVLKNVVNTAMPLTIQQFTAFGNVAQNAFEQAKNAALDAGLSASDAQQQAILAIGPMLAQLQQAAAAYGLTLDAGTQALIDQAKAAGVAFATSPMDRVAQAMDRVVVAVEKLAGITHQSADEMERLARAAGSVGSPGSGNGTTGQGGPDTNPNDPSGYTGYASGTDGFKDFGSGTPVMLHGWEAVVPKGDAGALGASVNYAPIYNIDVQGAGNDAEIRRAINEALQNNYEQIAQRIRDLVKNT